MFKALYNQAIFEASLVPNGPVLIRAGQASIDPTAMDMSPVRTTLSDGRQTVYLPGPSLKGVLRAHAERLLRSIGMNVCDPFSNKSDCRTIDQKANGPTAYSKSCKACRTFGSTSLAGRFRIGDAYPDTDSFAAANTTEGRHGVGIDRKTGGSARGVLYDLEVITSGRFVIRATLENYQLWQLGLVLQTFWDLDNGLVQVGSCKSRGMGSMHVVEPSLATFALKNTGREVLGMDDLANGNLKDYGLVKESSIKLPDSAKTIQRGLKQGAKLSGWEPITELLTTLGEGPWSELAATVK